MSEEVTYADLKFPDSFKAENIETFDNFETKGSSAPSNGCHHRVQILSVLCLLLLIGLGILGGMFYATSKKQMGKLNELQDLKEGLQGNVSQLLMDNLSSSTKIKNLSITLQEMATKLCRELNNKREGHKCKPCPKKWLWHDNSCYLINEDSRSWLSWQESKMECSAQNASLLKINNTSVLNFIKSKNLYLFWLGLSPTYSKKKSQELDELINSPEWNISNINESFNSLYCGYLNGYNVEYYYCTSKQKYICIKLAIPVKIENTLDEVEDGSI